MDVFVELENLLQYKDKLVFSVVSYQVVKTYMWSFCACELQIITVM